MKQFIAGVYKEKHVRIAAIVSLLVLVLFLVPLNFLKGTVESVAMEALGHPVTVNGNITIGLAPWGIPALVLRDVEVKSQDIVAEKVKVSVPLLGHVFLRVRDLSFKGEDLGSGSFPVRLSTEGFSVSGLSWDRGDAEVSGDISYLDGNFGLDVVIRDLSYRDAAPTAAGAADLQARLDGKGKTAGQIVRSLKGNITLIGGRGKIPGEAMKVWTKGLLRNIFEEKKEYTKINCLVADFDVSGGVAHHKALFLDTEDAAIFGQGTIDLFRRKVDIVLSPKPKRTALVSLATPVHVIGPVDKITVVPVASAVAKGFGKLLLGAVNPAAAVLSSMKLGSEDNKDICAGYLERI